MLRKPARNGDIPRPIVCTISFPKAPAFVFPTRLVFHYVARIVSDGCTGRWKRRIFYQVMKSWWTWETPQSAKVGGHERRLVEDASNLALMWCLSCPPALHHFHRPLTAAARARWLWVCGRDKSNGGTFMRRLCPQINRICLVLLPILPSF